MQENNPISVPVVTTPQAMEQPKQSNFLTILLSVLLVISVSIAAFFAYQTQKLVAELRIMNDEVQITPAATTEPVATESSEVDPTANWKTYTNTKSGFEFKYPTDWDTYQPVVEGGVLRLYVAPKNTINEISDMYGRGGGFGGGKFFTFTISEVEEIPNYKSDEYEKITSNSFMLSSLKTIRYFKEALQSMPGFDAGDKTETVVFQKDGKNYLISLIDYQYKTVFDQILSTFKFLE